jgi:hypothetical protein
MHTRLLAFWSVFNLFFAQNNVFSQNNDAATVEVSARANEPEDVARRETLRYLLKEKENNYLSAAGKKDPAELVKALNSVGWYELLTGEPAKAEQRFRRAIELDSNNIYPLTNLPHALFFQGKSAESERLYFVWMGRAFLPGTTMPTFRQAFLEDFKTFEKKGLVADSLRGAFDRLNGFFLEMSAREPLAPTTLQAKTLNLPLPLNDETARAFSTPDNSPEAAVATFVASRIRGDEGWKSVVQSASDVGGLDFWTQTYQPTYAEIWKVIHGADGSARVQVLFELKSVGNGQPYRRALTDYFECRWSAGRWLLVACPKIP